MPRPRRRRYRIAALALEGAGVILVLVAAWQVSHIAALVLAGLGGIGVAQVLEELL